MPFDWAPHLAADGVEPAWLAREYGYRGPARYTWLAPYPGASRKVRVWWVAWPRQVTWLPHNLRHALITAVARRALRASPDAWDNLVVWDSRRTPWGRQWARQNRDYIRWIRRERGGARPDAEWWPRVAVAPGRWRWTRAAGILLNWPGGPMPGWVSMKARSGWSFLPIGLRCWESGF